VISLPVGEKAHFERSRTVTYDVGFDLSSRLGLSTKATILALKSEVRHRVEAKLKATFQESKTKRQGFEVDGDKVRKVRVTWVDRYRSGTATMNVNGAKYVLPFRFPVGTDLVVEEVKD
jgi:hypothetical protein